MNDYKVEWPITMKMNHATNELGDCEQFTEEEFMTWEDKDEEDKTWISLVQYFTKLWRNVADMARVQYPEAWDMKVC